MDKTVKSWFSHNIEFSENIKENFNIYDILICCNATYYYDIMSNFDILSFPFKNRKIGIGSITPEYYKILCQKQNEIKPLLIFIDDENQGKEFYMQSNSGLISNSWILVNPSLSHNQEYTNYLESDLLEGILKFRFIGHQTHITPTEMLEFLQNHKVESMRLGQVRQNIDVVEPWCRAVDHVIFHTESLRKTDFPSKLHSNPGGFTYEEACKLSQFIGASSHLKSIAYLLPPDQPLDTSSFAVLSQLVWYLIDGYHNFREDNPVERHKLTQYIVHASHRDLDINFWKNNESGRWWMEVPGHENYWISCTYDDYLEASQGEFSSKLIRALNRV